MNTADPQAVAAARVTDPGWPLEPYKGLAYYDAADRALFSGRDFDVDMCIQRLTAVETRILLIHGHTGCGKSSFVRAGLIPELEGMDEGYLFMRDSDGSPQFIRSGADPLGRLTECLYQFASKPLIIRTAKGSAACDLSEALLGHGDLASFTKDCRLHGALRKSLHIISEKLPLTLIIVLDQMEEVITLFTSGSPYRRQFFQFIKGFSSINFSVKFVFALRKDYSGQFIELAQMGGSVDLRDTPQAAAPEMSQDVQIKSDVKLYLLPELDKAKVKRAIELPTATECIAGETSPFDFYRFCYEPRVVDKIVANLFERSGAAVLPAMQIVCRDLWKDAKPKADKTCNEITLEQYKNGGDIAGPIDRHVSQSLKDAFGMQFKVGVLAREEDRWRDVLFRLVRLESDGTAHTREIEAQELVQWAKDGGAISDPYTVIAYLTRPEVLLLRSVQSDVTAPGAHKLSLGHDFIAMVLHRWKAGCREREAARALTRKFVGGSAVALLVLTVAVGLAAWALKVGRDKEEYDVLLNTTHTVWRQQPNSALMTAVAGTVVADRGKLLGMQVRDAHADHMLADLLAGMPDEATAGWLDRIHKTQALQQGIDIVFPLPASSGFLAMSGDKAIFSTPSGVKSFDLTPLPAAGTALGDSNSQASEVSAGKVLLVRTRTAPFLPTVVAYQVYVLNSDGTSAGPFKPEDFDGLPAKGQAMPQMTVTGRFVVSTLGRGPDSESHAEPLLVRAYAYDAAARGSPFTLRTVLHAEDLDAGDASKGSIAVLGGAIVVEPHVDREAARSARRFDLGAETVKATDLVSSDASDACTGRCPWRWLPFVTSSGTTLVFGLPDPSRSPTESDLWSGASAADLGLFLSFLFVDVPSGRFAVVSAAAINQARGECPAYQSESYGARQQLPLATGQRAFVTQGPAGSGPLMGIISGNSIDLLQINQAGARTPVNCKDSLLFNEPLDRWAVTQDGGKLLAGGTASLASWNLSARIAEHPAGSRQAKELRQRACTPALRNLVQQFALPGRWEDLTHLSKMPPDLCGLASGAAPTSAPAR